jgi:hypothetical protein
MAKILRKIETIYWSYNPKTDKREDYGVIISVEPTDYRNKTQELVKLVMDYIHGMFAEKEQALRMEFGKEKKFEI